MAIAQTLINIDHKLDDIDRLIKDLNVPESVRKALVAKVYDLWEAVEAAAEEHVEVEAE